MLKKSRICIFVFLMTLFVGLQAFAENDVTKTEVVNVARAKSVMMSNPYSVSAAPYKLTDGVTTNNSQNMAFMGTAKDSYFQIDLENRYIPQRLRFYLGTSMGQWYNSMKNFIIVGSNSEDFLDEIVLYDATNKDLRPSDWKVSEAPREYYFDVNIPEEKICRYIRIRKTDVVQFGYTEVEVYAKQTLTDVARGKNVSASGYISGYEPYNAVDGLNLSDTDAWVCSATNSYTWLNIDLGREYKIEKVEIESRINNRSAERMRWNLYGSLNGFADVLSSNDAYLDVDKYDYLEYMTTDESSCIPTYTTQNPVYKEIFVNGKMNSAREKVDADNIYRYLMLRHWKTQENSGIGEFRAYVVPPVLLSSEINYDKAILQFNQPINEQELNEDTVSVKSENGDELEFEINKLDDGYTYEIRVLNNATNSYQIRLSQMITNEYGVSLVVDENYHLMTGNEIDVVELYTPEITANGTFTAELSIRNNSEENQTLYIIAAKKSPAKLVGVNMERITIPSGLKTIPFDFDSFDTDKNSTVTFYVMTEQLKPVILPVVKSVKVPEIKYEYYVSPNGSDNHDGSFESPFRTIEAAKIEISENSDYMEQDVHVYLMNGTHYLDNTLEFTVEDSGKNGYKIIYESYGDGETVISGGTELHMSETTDGFWKVATDIEYVGELYVNDKKAKRASPKDTIEVVSIYSDEDSAYERDGILVNSADIPEDFDYENAQLHFVRGWKSHILNITGMKQTDNGTVLYLMQPHFNNLTATDGNHYINEDSCFYIENDRTSLDEGGEFFFDKNKKEILYKPREGEILENSVVVAPRLETIVNIKGESPVDKVSNLEFKNLTFAHGAWFAPGTNGFVTGQTANMVNFNVPQMAYEPGINIVPANIRLDCAENVGFAGNVIKFMAGVGIGMYNGVTECDVSANVFEDIADSAITVGLMSHDYIMNEIDGVDLAANRRTVSACSSASAAEDYKANDGVNRYVWSPSDSLDDDHKHWWMIDLGDSYEIDRVEIDARYEADQIATRRNFRILASNDPEFKTFITIGTQGKTAFGATETAVFNVTDSGKYRYVKVEKTEAEYFVISDIRVINESMGNTPAEEVCKNISITDNYIQRIGNGHYGASGIQTFYTDGVNISHNELYDLPYSGICVGWGWTNTKDSQTAKNNIVTNNYIHNYCQKAIDGGGIYTLGNQPGSVISGNYITDQKNVYAGIYLDAGSQYFTVSDNVVDRTLLSYLPGASASDITFSNNYMTSVPSINNGVNYGNAAMIYFDSANPNSFVTTIIQNAGINPEYLDMKLKASDNLYPMTDTDIYKNVIHETQYGVMHDERFVEMYLKNPIKAAEELSEIARKSGNYKYGDLLEFELAILKAKSVASAETIVRENVLKAKQELDTAIKKLQSSKMQ